MKSVDLAPHEFHANLLFGADGLDPFFALDSTVKAAEGSRTDHFTAQSERWRVRLSYQDTTLGGR
jgi:hypothetical protein